MQSCAGFLPLRHAGHSVSLLWEQDASCQPNSVLSWTVSPTVLACRRRAIAGAALYPKCDLGVAAGCGLSQPQAAASGWRPRCSAGSLPSLLSTQNSCLIWTLQICITCLRLGTKCTGECKRRLVFCLLFILPQEFLCREKIIS